MIWALLEIALPLVIAMLVGIFIGWLFWRWRRRSVSTHEWNRLNAGTESAMAELASVRAAHDEVVNERTALAARVASINADVEAKGNELELARRRIAELAGELDGADRLAAELSEATTRVTALESGLASARRTISGLQAAQVVESDSVESNSTLIAVRAELDAAQARIADLESMLAAARRDADATAAAAAQATTPEGDAALAAEIGQLRVELAERDRRIRALEQATRGADD